MPIEADRIRALRWRASLLLLGGVTVGSTAFIISMTVTALAAESIAGDPTWSGVPVAVAILGAAAGTSLLAASMVRWGRRRGLIGAYALASVGGLVACLATSVASLPLLIAGVFMVGVGNSANALTRYVAADLQTPDRRATMIGWIVWSGTIGAVAGPNLLAPSNDVGASLGLPPLAGAYLASSLTYVAAAVLYLIALRPDPSMLTVGADEGDAGEGGANVGLPRLLRDPRVQVSAVALVLGHMVMVLIMTMTPLHVRSAGHGLGVVGGVASSHMVGMFLFSPLTGWLVDRIGAIRVILAGQALLLGAALGGVVVSPASPIWTGATLFVLGLGWNLGFVAASAHLTCGVAAADRDVLQGRTDSAVWIGAAGASLLSSVLFSTVGFDGLSAVGATTMLVSVGTIVMLRRRSPV